MKKWTVLFLSILIIACISGCIAENPFNPAAIGVGDIVTFGSYEQDGDMDNGPEPIEWKVLEVQGEKILLLSKYGLDAKPYNEDFSAVTWSNCTLRNWLNDEFLNLAFSEEEQADILLTDVDNSDQQGFDWTAVTTLGVESNPPGGDDTQDKIFLLSYQEASLYLGVGFMDRDNMISRAEPTAYALMNGAGTVKSYETMDGHPAGRWWLRSPGRSRFGAMSVFSYGSAMDYNVNDDGADGKSGCVRPALWLNLE